MFNLSFFEGIKLLGGPIFGILFCWGDYIPVKIEINC
jgi:hypothetical protein